MGNVIVCIAKSIKVLCAYRDINITQLGYKLGLSKENFHAQIKRDNFRINDIVKIADTLGYDINIQFVDQTNGKIIDVEREDSSVIASEPIQQKQVSSPSVSVVPSVPVSASIAQPAPPASPVEETETNFDNWKSKYEQITDIPSPKNLIPLNFKKDEDIKLFPWENE